MRKWLLIAIMVIALTQLTGEGAAGTRIMCTNSVLADFTENVVNGTASVEYIMPAGACPAQFDTCPSDVNRIADADIVVSLGWEPWLESLLEASENDDVHQVRCPGLGEWNIPSGARSYVDRIAAGLNASGLLDNGMIGLNAVAYKAEIDAKAAELQALVLAHGQVGIGVIVMEWHEDFVAWLGYEIVAVYGPPGGLSAQDALDITEKAKNAIVIIDNLQSGTDFGANVASESHAIHVIVTNFPGAIPGTGSYLEMIEYNTMHLIDGVETYRYKEGDIADLEDEVSALEVQRMALSASTGILGVMVIMLLIMYRRK